MHGATGWVFRSGDIGDLLDAIEITRNDTAVSAAGRAAYERFWAEPPDRARHTDALVSIYDRVMARGVSGRLA